MAGKVVSIEIGYLLTRVCEADFKAKTHKVYKSFTIPTPEGVINDGALMVTPEFADALRVALAKNKIKAKQVVFSITSAKIASREVTIPFVKENRIADVVNANASDYFPVDLGQYKLAYSILGTIGETKGSQQYKLLVMAAPVALLNGYYDLARMLKLDIAALDYAGNSLYQVLREECTKGNDIIIKIDERTSHVMALKNGVIDFSRNVAYGVEETIEAVSDSLVWGEITDVMQAMDVLAKNMCVLHTPKTDLEDDTESSSTESIREESSSAEDSSAQDGGTQENSVLRQAQMSVTQALMPLINGIARVVEYYASRNGNEAIDRVIITGLGGNVQGIDGLLAAEINHPVEILTKATGWALEKSFEGKPFGEYIACVGATAQPVGFKKEGEQKRGSLKGNTRGKKKIDGMMIAVAVCIIGIVVAIVLCVASLVPYTKVKKENNRLQEQEAKLTSIIPIYNDYVSTKSEYTKVTAMYQATENRNDELYEFLSELEQKLPKDVALVSFVSEDGVVTMNMNVSTKGEAASVIEQMRTFKSLVPGSVTVTSLVVNEDEESGTSSVNFTISASYWPVGYEPEETAEETQE